MTEQNSYTQKQLDKQAKLKARAERAEQEAGQRFAAAMTAIDGIPPGQPILVGHHSEGRHRAALRRHDRNMRKAIEAQQHAEDLRRRADAVGTGGISSDDPAAASKLGDKVEALKKTRELMKRANAYYRKHSTLDGADIPEEMKAEAIQTMKLWGGVYSAPFPPYALQNIGARIRSASQRAQTIEEHATGEHVTEVIGQATITQDPTENRVLLSFPERLSKEDWKVVRSHGFVWSPTRKAFVRKLNNAAIYAARQVAKQFDDKQAN